MSFIHITMMLGLRLIKKVILPSMLDLNRVDFMENQIETVTFISGDCNFSHSEIKRIHSLFLMQK
jgi:hypothetical protein